MRGDMSIKELRRMGKKPVQVWVFLLGENSAMPKTVDPEDMLLNGMPPEVHLEPHEDLYSIDFRFLAGVIVHLQGEEIDRLREAFQRIRACKPSRIIASGAAFYDTEQHA